MAKDITDYSTVDFIPPELHVACGQVLMDRQQQLAIVARKDDVHVHLVREKSGLMRLTKHTAQELVEHWSDAEFPVDEVLPKLLALSKQLGATQAARQALDKLVQQLHAPQQNQLFV